jgi:hypothetical protein
MNPISKTFLSVMMFGVLIAPACPVFAGDDEADKALSAQIKPLSSQEQQRMKEIFGSTPVTKEQRCSADYNCCTTRYFDRDNKLIGSSEGCMKSNPDEPFKYSPKMEFFDRDGKLIKEELTLEKE